jgi:uroporphyrinogen decarboxylase
MIKVPLQKPTPDINNFLKVIKGEIIPDKPPLIELFLDYEIVREISINHLNRNWVEPSSEKETIKQYLKNWIEVYWKMGYDYIRMSGGLDFPLGISRKGNDTALLSRGNRNWAEEGKGPISTWEDFEKYPWPNLEKIDLWQYEFVAKNLPEGMGLFVCPTSGFLEIPLDSLLGYENLCFLLFDNPSLVESVFQKVGESIYGFYQKIIGLPKLAGFFQGDDMGFKTGTLISPKDIKNLVLPWHKKLCSLAHKNGLIYLLHVCGQIDEIMDILINDVKIDGRHSFEDEGNSVIKAKEKYGDKIAILGGIDVDKLSRLSEKDLRKHVRNIIEKCLPGGRFALGSGNTVTNYVPVKNYFAMVEEDLNL